MVNLSLELSPSLTNMFMFVKDFIFELYEMKCCSHLNCHNAEKLLASDLHSAGEKFSKSVFANLELYNFLYSRN